MQLTFSKWPTSPRCFGECSSLYALHAAKLTAHIASNSHAFPLPSAHVKSKTAMVWGKRYGEKIDSKTPGRAGLCGRKPRGNRVTPLLGIWIWFLPCSSRVFRSCTQSLVLCHTPYSHLYLTRSFIHYYFFLEMSEVVSTQHYYFRAVGRILKQVD